MENVFELAVLLKSVPCATFKICFKLLTYYLKLTFFCENHFMYGVYA